MILTLHLFSKWLWPCVYLSKSCCLVKIFKMNIWENEYWKITYNSSPYHLLILIGNDLSIIMTLTLPFLWPWPVLDTLLCRSLSKECLLPNTFCLHDSGRLIKTNWSLNYFQSCRYQYLTNHYTGNHLEKILVNFNN